MALRALYYDPLWVFHAAGLGIKQLSELRGKRIDVGAEGSGTKVLAMQLLALNDVSVQNAKIFSQGWEKAAQMLIQGEIDAAFFVTAYHSPVIRRFLFSKDIQLNCIQKG
jgi:TRAP-type uncharacterized transport system substrate-binding protein